MIPNRLEAAHQAARCNHIRLNGLRCGAPAIAGARLCRLHLRALRPKVPNYSLPFVEDASSAQLALNIILRALQDKAWDLKTCALMLYDLQISCSSLKRLGDDLPAAAESDEPSLAHILLQKLDQMAAEHAAEEAADQSPEPEPDAWDKKPPSSASQG